jgi:hypothetical protein
MILDTYTEKHFQAWLDRHVRIDEHDYIRYQIMQLLEEHGDLLESHGWTELRDMAGAW